MPAPGLSQGSLGAEEGGRQHLRWLSQGRSPPSSRPQPGGQSSACAAPEAVTLLPGQRPLRPFGVTRVNAGAGRLRAQEAQAALTPPLSCGPAGKALHRRATRGLPAVACLSLTVTPSQNTPEAARGRKGTENMLGDRRRRAMSEADRLAFNFPRKAGQRLPVPPPFPTLTTDMGGGGLEGSAPELPPLADYRGTPHPRCLWRARQWLFFRSF